MPRVTVLTPAYFPAFRCKCGECRSVCCRGWRITISAAEYFRALGQDCSEALRRRMDTAFCRGDAPSEEEFAYIAPTADGNCALLDPDGFCALHRECGEAAQPAVCRLYPRSVKPGAVTEACCSGSCEKTVEMLMDAPFPLPFLETELTTRSPLPSSPTADPETPRVMREAIACWQEDADARGGFARLAAYLRLPTPDPPSPEAFLQAAYRLVSVFGARSVTLCDLSDEALAAVGMEEGVGADSAARYAEAEARFLRALPRAPEYFSNLLANHMFYERFPRASEGVSDAEALAGLEAVRCLLCFFCVTLHDPARARDRFADVAAAVLRYVEHTDFYANVSRLTAQKNGPGTGIFRASVAKRGQL
jgi:hypothetical protein